MAEPQKILAVQFMYFGDAVLMVPTLRSLREHWPDCSLHVLVAAEVAPLLHHLPWVTRVWGMPRTRGKAAIRTAWPFVRALRKERFDRSVDFGGNDRGAILSRLAGARIRLGPTAVRGFLGRRFCYTQMVPANLPDVHESRRVASLLSAWGVPAPHSLELEIRSDPSLEDFARKLVPGRPILCHLSTGQPKKEWPLSHWADLFRLASERGMEMVFSSGVSPRERALLDQMRTLVPQAPILPALPNLAEFLALLKRARVFVGGDTGPLHAAAGLGVPTVALYGPTPVKRWAPIGEKHCLVQGTPCTCPGHIDVCNSPAHCLASISPASVFGPLCRAWAAQAS